MANGTDQPTGAAPAGAPPARSRPTAGLAALAIVLIVGAGVGGYFIGHSAADASGAKKEGLAKGRSEVRAQYRPGAPGYQSIYQAGQSAGRTTGMRTGEQLGVRQGERVGLEQGKQQGQQQGQAQGVQTGAQTALGNFSTWETGVFYVVKLQPGTVKGVPYQVQGRNLLLANRVYAICADNPAEVCSRPAQPGPG
jgi:hypothetical protein